jgi:hypothetical protein
VYSTCLFCNARLGANEVIEHFPVGKRLAFDASRGRLWVVCVWCGRWNLSPLEERWEAIEECERLFPTVPLRRSTEQIGLARHPAGLDLVRVGRPPRPELAAWRYTGEYEARNRREALWTGVTTAGLWIGVLANHTAAVAVGGVGSLVVSSLLVSRMLRRSRRPVARVTTPEGGTRVIRGKHARYAKLIPSEGPQGWALQVPHASGAVEVWGETALHTAARILAHHNFRGADAKGVQAAARELERVEHPTRYFGTALEALRARRFAPVLEPDRYRIWNLPAEVRLALEMAAQEETERRAMEGELRLLEQAWREAEQIASIADTLALPPGMARLLGRERDP